MYDRDSQTLRRDEEQLRQSAVANEWTEGQATRLDTTPEVILEAIRRGWFPEQIEAVTSRYALEDNPPLLEGVPEWTDILIAKQCRAKARAKDTAMALAYREAKNRAA
jgi:hypothetical protein